MLTYQKIAVFSRKEICAPFCNTHYFVWFWS